MDLQEILEMAERVHRVAARGMEPDSHALPCALLVEWPEIAMGNIAAAVIGIDHDAYRAEFRNSPHHFVDRCPDVDMQRHQRHTLEAVAVAGGPIIEPMT